MERVNRKNCTWSIMKGRTACPAFGSNGYVKTDEAFMGFVTFSPQYGEMEPHYHGPEILYVEDAKGAYVRFGESLDKMDRVEKLEKGEVICAGDGEWHKFEFDCPDGFVSFIVFMGEGAPKTINASDL